MGDGAALGGGGDGGGGDTDSDAGGGGCAAVDGCDGAGVVLEVRLFHSLLFPYGRLD